MRKRRLLEGGGGLALALWGLARGGLAGAGAGMAGGALLVHAAMGRDRDRRIRVHRTMTIAAPVEDVYAFWSRFENFPRFMEHVLEVHAFGDSSHWRVTGPAGIPIEWDAEVIDRVPGRAIAWCSLEGSEVELEGEVHFESIEAGATRVDFHLSYLPPSDAPNRAVAAFLLGDPKTQVDDDLLRLQSLLSAAPPATAAWPQPR